MSFLERHHVYLQTLDLLQSTRRVPYRSLPYIMVLGDSWLDYPGRNREFIAHRCELPAALLELLAASTGA